MKIKDIMTKDVLTLERDDDIKMAARAMDEHDIGSLPVVDTNSKVVGIVTDRDIVRRGLSLDKNPKDLKVSEVMTSNPITCSSDKDVSEAVRLMSERQVRRLPIVDDNSLVGMVALGDISVESSNSGEEALKNISSPCVPKI